MVISWYINEDSEDDFRSEKHTNPQRFVNAEDLKLKAGLIQYNLDAEHYDQDGKLEEIKKQYNCNHFDFVYINPSKNPEDLKLLQRVYQEHLHAEEEVRFVLDGSAYFDIRDKDDKWIRVKVQKGDLIILPPGVYHRFTLGFSNSIRLMRLFKQPKWNAFNRCAEEHPSRQIYLQMAANGFA